MRRGVRSDLRSTQMHSQMSKTADCALLVCSCDAYQDLWVPFFSLFGRHWPDCPLPLYLGAGQRSYPDQSVVTLHSSGGRNWSRCLRDYLEVIPNAYVLMMLDDFFIRGRVATDRVLHCLSFAQENQAIQVRLVPKPPPTARIPKNWLIGECSPSSPYRLSTQAAIWDRALLLTLLRDGESIWDFEHNGNTRIATMPTGFFCTRSAVIPYLGTLTHHVIEKGKWLPHEKWIFGSRNIGCNFAAREVMGWPETIVYLAISMADRALRFLPWRVQATLKAYVKRLVSSKYGQQLEHMSGRNSPGPRRRSAVKEHD